MSQLQHPEDILVINGQRPLNGEVSISGAKNSVLKLMSAAILSPHPITLHNVPQLSDVAVMSDVIRHLGVKVDHSGDVMHIDASEITTTQAPYELVSKMRASFLVLGALLGRCGEARVALPGGCSIGKRGVDLHLKGLATLGAEITTEQGDVQAKATQLTGRQILLDTPSVGATENIMLAAVLANGTTTICNAAQEPEIQDLANFINAIGGDIHGAGTSEITINGVTSEKMCGTTFTVVPDRIEATTYITAAIGTHGSVCVKNIIPQHLVAMTRKLEDMGASITQDGPNSLIAKCTGRLEAQNIVTQPYPGFPTDCQAPFMTLLSIAQGTSIITETLYENRFKQVGELVRMGAKIKQEGNIAAVTGVKQLTGTQVRASDLRAGAGLIIAGLIATGRTEIFDLHHIDRGYDCYVEKLQAIGADVIRTTTTERPEESATSAL